MKSEAYTKSHAISVSTIIDAPLRFVYDWCTDYRESDPKIMGSKTERKILLRTEHRVIYISEYRSGGKPRSGVNVVTLYPPNAWHLDFMGDEDDETGDYLLTKLSPRKTRLDMKFIEHYKTRNAPTRAQDTKHTRALWNKIVTALKTDYANRK